MMDKNKETKHDKFLRIVPKRLKSFKMACERLAKLGNKYQFKFSKEDKKVVFDCVDSSTKKIKDDFNETEINWEENGEE